MIRTRDFLLFLISVTFLLVAIGTELVKNAQIDLVENQPEIFTFFDQEPTSYSAEVIAVPDTKSEKLAALRLALVEYDSIISAPLKEEVVADEIIPPPDTTVVAPAKVVIQLCKNYRPGFVPWTTDKIFSEEREGVRIFFTKSSLHEPSLTSTVSDEVVYAVLPIRSLPLTKSTCINGDVIGIALDGSLIRNAEQKTYGVFGEATMIGYALDGFPIYGVASSKDTDVCGGIIVESSYRYYLDKKRDGILGCFSGIPVTL
ncbi:hypothetical protein CO026_03205 [Candidatus Kaiserbacteria bacterium CG_4_9_14_0_2_um_filter_41_32]|uniref:Uncharacterized protein n=1 Tax=Candidatus Kaiserbacteria bacterium CG_4_9_14_0_2_um_filter_41_32 TaxID=1974601 RepID=A0A2M8FE94_9BACT|nr:MAG: hypothetical protein CO026_03205 [Candidatus Kaiserbacteria bacterium CG_4_9_14_0_2_um_filter_41_32]